MLRHLSRARPRSWLLSKLPLPLNQRQFANNIREREYPRPSITPFSTFSLRLCNRLTKLCYQRTGLLSILVLLV
jgi:hypothetical protein